MKVWNKQNEKDLSKEIVDWSSTYYSVILKDLTERTVVTFADESYDGTINEYYEYTDGDNEFPCFDEILLWCKIDE